MPAHTLQNCKNDEFRIQCESEYQNHLQEKASFGFSLIMYLWLQRK